MILSYGVGRSEPGDPPGVDTGTLKNSTRWIPDDSDKLKAYVLVQPEYAPFLEFGTDKMAARPFFGPVFERWRQGEFRRYLVDIGILR